MTLDPSAPVSKVLVHDSLDEHARKIKQYCEDQQLITVKASENNILDVLKSYVDLGGVFLSEDINGIKGEGIRIGQEIHKIRPELPIFLRLESSSTNLDEALDKVFCASYTIDNIDKLKQTIDQHIFCNDYPNALLRGIEEITRDSLYHFFDCASIEVSAPYLVKDRIIFGELFSLIPIESCWCKGYMTLQSEEANVRKMVKEEKVSNDGIDPDDFRFINDVLSEITNMAWGGIRNRFVSATHPESDITSQVPIIVNHKHKYITFGTNTPQLCFRYTIRGNDDSAFSLYIKFVFNLYWESGKFSENEPSVSDLVTSGELEFF